MVKPTNHPSERTPTPPTANIAAPPAKLSTLDEDERCSARIGDIGETPGDVWKKVLPTVFKSAVLVRGVLLMPIFNAKRHPHKHERRDAADAFFPDPGEGPALAPDDLAEGLAEDFMMSATTGQEQGAEAHEQFVEEEVGGPFVMTLSRVEFARAYDESNTPEAEREPLPTAGPWLRDSTVDDDAE